MTESQFDTKVNAMTNEERVIYRNELEALGDERYLARNLWYNYSTQEWVE